jgi:hypothetical protein
MDHPDAVEIGNLVGKNLPDIARLQPMIHQLPGTRPPGSFVINFCSG